MKPHEVEAVAHEAFLKRAKEFLASDPYWVHLLVMEGGRTKRKQVAREFAKQMCIIPKVGDNGP
jgi:hypothetical protein